MRVDHPGVFRRFDASGRSYGGDTAAFNNDGLIRWKDLTGRVDDSDVSEGESLRNNSWR